MHGVSAPGDLDGRGRRAQYIAPGTKEHTVIAPAQMDFDDNLESTLDFLDRILRWVLKRNRTVYVRLDTVTSMTPEAGFALAATIQRCMDLKPNAVNGSFPRSHKVRRLLTALGFSELLEILPVPESDAAKSKRRYMSMVSGNQGDTAVFPDFIRKIFGDVARFSQENHFEVENALKGGLGEAMLNVVQHAYNDVQKLPFPIGKPNRWWLAGYRDAEAREVCFMFIDQGATIPQTLPLNFEEHVKKVTAKVVGSLQDTPSGIDGELVLAAMNIGRTGKAQRAGQGRGLNDLKDFIQLGVNADVKSGDCDGCGTLRILSRCGSYLYEDKENETCVSLNKPLNGTLIVWRLSAGSAIEWNEIDE